jgi:hypothetical protein
MVVFCITCLSVVAGILLIKHGASITTKVDSETQCRVRCVKAAVLPKIDAFGSCINKMQQAFGYGSYRYYYKTDSFPALNIDLAQISKSNRKFKPYDYGFDLWQIASDLDAPKDSAIALTFEIVSEKSRQIYLGLGASHQYVVLSHDKPVRAVVGVRTLLFNQDLCKIDVEPGKNEITVIFQRLSTWTTIPNDHFQPEWSAEIELFGSAEIAWANHIRNIFHTLDTAIMPDIDKLRLEAAAEGFTDVTLCGLDGTERCRGTAQPDGTIKWQDASRLGKEPFFGFLTLGNAIGEPVMILGDHDVETVVQSFVPTQGVQNPENDAWRFRLNHLLKPEFKTERNRTWTRKVVQSLAMVALSNDNRMLESWQKKCPSLRIELHAYKSSIDGTTQYYHLFRCSGRKDRVPLVVSLPPVPETIRPYLQSATIANMPGFEATAIQAEQMNIDVLWPGIVDIDYGGKLCQTEVAECIAAASRIRGQQRAGGLYLSGICSSGVSAINCSNNGYKVDGVVLHTPVISRNVTKCLADTSFDTLFPPDVLKSEETDNDITHFKKVPVILIYDTEMFGHGDRERSHEFESKLKSLGADIESYWPTPWVSMPWGERDNTIMKKWLGWINNKASTNAINHQPDHASKTIKPLASVKEALLQGFQIEPTNDAFFSQWQAGWELALATYRGAGRSLLTGNDVRTSVTFRVLSNAETSYDRIKEMMPGNPVLEKHELSEVEVERSSILFGFRLVASPAWNASGVELIRSDFSNITPPSMDLLLDGCCRGALWKYDRNTWVLVDVWL